MSGMSSRRWPPWPIVLIFLATGVACGDEPLGVSVQGTFTIIGSRSPPPDYQPTFVAQGGMGTADLNGNFWGTECGRRLVPEFFRNEDLIFRLTFVPIANISCPAVALVSDYEAVFQGIPAGQYQLRVIYDSEGADEALRFEAGTVTVR